MLTVPSTEGNDKVKTQYVGSIVLNIARSKMEYFNIQTQSLNETVCHRRADNNVVIYTQHCN